MPIGPNEDGAELYREYMESTPCPTCGIRESDIKHFRAEVSLYKERYELEQARYEGISSANDELRSILSRVEDVEGWLAKESMSVRFDTPVRRLRDISRAVRDYLKGAD